MRPAPEGTAMESLVQYLEKYLRLGHEFTGSMGNVQVERVPYGKKSKFKNELLVRFPTTKARDIVRGAASNLADYGAEVGLRIECPNHLKSGLRALMAASYTIRTKHPAAKRNVLFDLSLIHI